RTPSTYVAVVIAYALVSGAGYGAYTALIFLAIGKGAASAKYTIFGSMGNVPVVYMTVFDGWAHDRWGPRSMLAADGLLGLVGVIVGLVVLWRLQPLEQVTTEQLETV